MTEKSSYFADDLDVALLASIEDGLELTTRPYASIASELRISEAEVIARLERLIDTGIIKRFGLVLQHRRLGYRANAMVVWDVPDDEVDVVAEKIVANDFVTLCYCRRRSLPKWPYNLFCMVHGRERAVVEKQIAELKEAAGLQQVPSLTLFSLRRFKQRGARFSTAFEKMQEAAE